MTPFHDHDTLIEATITSLNFLVFF